jgi:hypothetical protein
MKVLENKYPINYNNQGNKTPGFYMDTMLYNNIQVGKKALRKDFDFFLVLDGGEGTGKSVLGQQIATAIDPTFNVDRVCFRAEEFKKAIISAEKYQAVVFDEAYGALSSRRAMSTINHTLVSLFTEIRQKNLAIILILPSFFDLDKYAAIHRSVMLIHIYHNHFKRGFFKVYSKKQKKLMYLLGKKTYNYNCVKSSFQGRFANFYCIDKDKYKKKKSNSMRCMDAEEDKEKKSKRQQQLEQALYNYTKNMSLADMEDLSVKMGQPPTFLRGFRQKYNEDLESQRMTEEVSNTTFKEQFNKLK